VSFSRICDHFRETRLFFGKPGLIFKKISARSVSRAKGGALIINLVLVDDAEKSYGEHCALYLFAKEYIY
jgi:hypothetical protein